MDVWEVCRPRQGGSVTRRADEDDPDFARGAGRIAHVDANTKELCCLIDVGNDPCRELMGLHGGSQFAISREEATLEFPNSDGPHLVY